MSSDAKSAKVYFPTVGALHTDPNVFLADSGSTTHATPHRQGMQNLRAALDSEFIETANGDQEKAAQIGDLPCVMFDKQGQELKEVTLMDVTYSLKFLALQSCKWKVGLLLAPRILLF